MNKNIFLIVMISIFLIGIVSADLLKLDNAKTYDPATKTVTITNFFGLGGEIAKVKLDTPQINYVIRGKDRLVAEFTINNSEAYNLGVLDKLDLYDNKKAQTEITRTFTYKQKVVAGTKDVPDYIKVCKEVENKVNGTKDNICTQEQSGTHKENIYEWKNFTTTELSSFKKGITTIGIFADVYPNDYVEWQPTLYGTKITEWATWKDSYNVSLLWIWHLDEPTGVKFPAFGNNDLNLSSGTYPVSVAGIHGNATRFDGLTQYLITKSSIATTAMFSLGTSVCFWGKSKTYSASNDAIPFRIGGIIFAVFNTGRMEFDLEGNNAHRAILTSTVNLNDWFFICGTGNTTNNMIYLNGTLEDTDVGYAVDYVTGEHITLGSYDTTQMFWNGTMDELMVWNRTLSATEISELYDGGAGTFYGVSPDNPPIFSNYWDNNGTQYNDGIGYFNVTVINTNGTVILTYNNTNYTATNSSGNATTFNFTITGLTNGTYSYNWSSWGNGTLNNFNRSEARRYTVLNDPEPTVTLVSPANNTNSSSSSVTFNCSGQIKETRNINNVSFWLNGIRNYTVTDGADNFTSLQITRSLTDGNYSWTCEASDNSATTKTVWASNRSLRVDVTAPVVTLVYPTNVTYTTAYAINSSIQITLNATYADTNLQACWIYNGTANTTVTCGQNLTITTGYSSYHFIFYANDSFGNLGSANVSANWIYTFLQNNITYNSTSYETTIENFMLNSSYDTSNYYSSSAKLNYNGVNYTSTRTAGTNILFSNAIAVPLTSTPANFTFYWIISLVNSSGTFQFNSTYNNQSITPLQNISVNSSCNAGFYPAFNFSILAESNQTSINASSITYNLQYGLAGNNLGIASYGSLANTNVFSICINNSYPTYTVGYGEIAYQQTGFNPRRFYIFSNTRMTNTTISNILYLLETSTSSQSFTINAKDSGLNPYSNNYISLLRWYPDLDTYKIVDMGKTDNQGNTQVYVRLNDIDYRVGLYEKDGTLIQLDSPTRFTCAALPCVYPIYVRTQQSFTNIFNIQQSLTYSNSTGISTFTYIWNDPSQTTTLMNLTVWKDTGTDSTLECSTSSSSFTGVLSCPLPVNSTGTFRAEVYRSASPSQPIITLIQSITIEAVLDAFIKLFFGFLIAAVIIFMGVYMGIVPAVFFGIIACVVLVFFGVVEWWMAAGIILVGIVILNTIKKT